VTGLDTNVLVRYIVQDDPVQSKTASDFIERKLSKDNYGVINYLVLCELVWVLAKCYKAQKENITKVIEQILRTEQFKVQDSQLVWLTLDDFKKGAADFSDYLVARLNQWHECETTITFDQRAGKSRQFQLLQ
jgi:predicted nucleic-acid-binding protein